MDFFLPSLVRLLILLVAMSVAPSPSESVVADPSLSHFWLHSELLDVAVPQQLSFLSEAAREEIHDALAGPSLMLSLEVQSGILTEIITNDSDVRAIERWKEVRGYLVRVFS